MRDHGSSVRIGLCAKLILLVNLRLLFLHDGAQGVLTMALLASGKLKASIAVAHDLIEVICSRSLEDLREVLDGVLHELVQSF